ncbi:hypothetical protein OY671_008617 [Metschnikowia pulcherrima]|nr:hypothetical protein OY671_008617 [Metschnikowia pulcherrima]
MNHSLTRRMAVAWPAASSIASASHSSGRAEASNGSSAYATPVQKYASASEAQTTPSIMMKSVEREEARKASAEAVAAQAEMNKSELSARVLECEPLRHTTAGSPASEMVSAHESEVIEAGHPRRVESTISAVASGDRAWSLQGTASGSELHVQGCSAPVRKDSVKFKSHSQQARKIRGSAGRDPSVA